MFATIERDRRHEHVSILAEQTVPARLFSKWAMARVSADGGPGSRNRLIPGWVLLRGDANRKEGAAGC